MGLYKSDRAFSLLSILLLVACGGLGSRGDDARPADGSNSAEAAGEAPLLDSVPGDVIEVGQGNDAGIVDGGAVGTAVDVPLVLDSPVGVDTPQVTNDVGAPDQVPGDGSGGTGGSGGGTGGSGGAGDAASDGAYAGTGGSGGAGDAASDGAYAGTGGSVATGGTVGSGGVHGTGGFATSTSGGNSGSAGGIVVPGSGGSGAVDANLDSEAVDFAVEDGGSPDDVPAGGEVLDAVGELLADVVAPTPDGTDACSARSADDSTGIFVSPSGAAGASCGTRQAPCASVQVGIANAKNSARAWVYVAPGLYVESISLVAGVSLDGGWSVQGDAWAPDCSAQASSTAVIQAPADKNITVLADALGGASSIRRITVLSKAQTDVLAGESLYGIFARGISTILSIDSVVVTMASAGVGASGVQGAPGAAASTTGCSPSADGAHGSTGTTGVGSDYGFTNAGYIQSNGYPGGNGGTGQNGSSATAGSNSGTCWPVSSCNDQVGCTGWCPTTPVLMYNNNPGLPGCGGPGGTGGMPGHGGGSSFALYVWDAQVALAHSELEAGSGGRGGDGGAGGPAAFGAPGAPGQSMPCDQSTVVAVGSGGADRRCQVLWVSQLPGGAPGGSGGDGGQGGPGGPGGGGWSCAYYRGGNGLIDLTTTSLGHGDPGQGGSPSGSPGLAMDACGEPGSPGVGTRTCAAFEIETFSVPFDPYAITAGPDGNVWILSNSYTSTPPSIGKVSPSGLITTFALPSKPFAITSGPDGNLWFTQPDGKIGRMSPAGDLTEFSGMGYDVRGIASGPDGNLWFTRSMYTPPFGKMTTSGAITSFSGAQGMPYHIAPGPNSDLWYTDTSRNVLGRIDMDGVQTEFSVPSIYSYPFGLTTGPDLNIWFAEQAGMVVGGMSLPSKICRSTVDGTMVEFPLPAGQHASDITTGPDGNLWFTVTGGVGRITPTGTITEVQVTGGSIAITNGPDGKLWFTQANGVGYICP